MKKKLYPIIGCTTSIWLLYWILQITTTCLFHTPSGSMMPILRPDESGLVNKWKLGARIFNVFDAVTGKPFEVYRLPGYGKLERNDIIVFNFPYTASDTGRDSIAMNLATYYCKRAVAVAGDTLEIKDCFYHVRGCPDTLGIASEQEMLRIYMRDFSRENPDTSRWPGWAVCLSYDSIPSWNIRDMGPFVIPGKGTEITMTHFNWRLYRKYIEWETGNKLQWQNNCAVMNGNPIKFYTFTENYCFAAGDHAIDSYDSRYFGLVPEKFIVGTAGLRVRSDMRDRLLRTINRH